MWPITSGAGATIGDQLIKNRNCFRLLEYLKRELVYRKTGLYKSISRVETEKQETPPGGL